MPSSKRVSQDRELMVHLGMLCKAVMKALTSTKVAMCLCSPHPLPPRLPVSGLKVLVYLSSVLHDTLPVRAVCVHHLRDVQGRLDAHALGSLESQR